MSNQKLLNTIAYDLNLRISKSNDLRFENIRIIYSAIGRIAFASLWDQVENEEGNAVSIIHFKRRIEKLLSAYCLLFPDLKPYMPSADELCKEIYKLYTCTGLLYHSSYRLTPSPEKTAASDALIYIRSANLNRKLSMSGLGTFIPNNHSEENNTNLCQLFQLHTTPMSVFWKQLIDTAKWTITPLPNPKEFLRLEPPFTKGYWFNEPPSHRGISLLRCGESGEKNYYLFENTPINGGYSTSQLPKWRSQKQEYRYLSNCLLAASNKLPPIIYHIQDDLVIIKLGYLLPPAEMYFLNLYSWPKTFTHLPCDFNRVMDKRVFYDFKQCLENIEFQFVEE